MTDETTPAAAPAETVDEPKRIDPEPEAKVEEPKADGGNDKGPPDDSNDVEGDEPEDKPKKLSGAQRAKIREEQLRNELRERERRLEELERQLRDDGGKSKSEAPKEEDFNGDWTAYVAARAAYEAGEAVEGKLKAREKSDLERRQADVKREREAAHLERVAEARETIADFDSVMATMKGVTIHDGLIEEIKASDKSPLLAYHLAKNPDKLRELNSMSGRELAREIGRLEGSIRMPAGKKQTTAPPPPSNLKGGAAPHVPLEAVDDMEEFAKRLKADLAKRRGR
jgi:hypothetical protein